MQPRYQVLGPHLASRGSSKFSGCQTSVVWGEEGRACSLVHLLGKPTIGLTWPQLNHSTGQTGLMYFQSRGPFSGNTLYVCTSHTSPPAPPANHGQHFHFNRARLQLRPAAVKLVIVTLSLHNRAERVWVGELHGLLPVLGGLNGVRGVLGPQLRVHLQL